MATNTGAIQNFGGNKIALLQATDAGALFTTAMTAGTNCYDLGHISQSSIGEQTTKTEYKSEDGKVRNTDYEYSLMTTGTLMQTDKAGIYFLAVTVKNKFYFEYKYEGLNDGKHQECFKWGKVTPQFLKTTPGAVTSFPYEFEGLFPDSAITITQTTLASLETALGIAIAYTGDVTIAADEGFVIYETTAS